MRNVRFGFAALLLASAAASGFAADVVILRGGSRIDLQEPPKQQGNTAILVRSDGTLLSVAMSEIDWKATAAARSRGPEPAKPVVVAPPSAPTDALRTGHEERARVRVTDADVGHAAELPARPGETLKPSEMKANAPRVEVGEYTQAKTGSNFVVTGQLVNPGTTSALNVRLMVTPVDEDGTAMTTAAAAVANGTIEGGRSVAFSVSIPVGEHNITQVRFLPQWQTPTPPPAPVAAAAPAAAAPAAAASKPPAPAVTPYGQGTLYAAPAPSAPMKPPADGNSGYIPGATTPDNQPKTPQ